MSRLLNGVVLCGVGAAALCAVAPVAAASPAGHPSNTIKAVGTSSSSETGASLVRPAPYVPPASVMATVDAKTKMLDNVMHGRPEMLNVSLRGTHGLPSRSADGHIGVDMVPPPSGSGLKIFYEGEGNGDKGYTCGPAATRNMVYNFLGRDYGEHQFEVWEHTSRYTGTNINNIAATLNAHFGSYGGWRTLAPTSSSNLGSAINIDARAGQEEIQNVDTWYLSFWGGHKTFHFDNAYGASRADIYVAEEYSPAAIGLHVSYSPFGFHIISASSDYYAVHYSPSGRIVY